MNKKNWLLVGLGAALATAVAVFLIKRSRNDGEEKPPKKAPQVPVDNPGDQSNFPISASESELG